MSPNLKKQRISSKLPPRRPGTYQQTYGVSGRCAGTSGLLWWEWPKYNCTTVVNRALGHPQEGKKPFSCKSPAEAKLNQRNPVRKYGSGASLTSHAFTKWLSTVSYYISYRDVWPSWTCYKLGMSRKATMVICTWSWHARILTIINWTMAWTGKNDVRP